MPPQFIYDISTIDLNRVLFDKDAIREMNPQRGLFEMLDAIVYVDEVDHGIIGYKDITLDDFWAPFHIPGRPLFPGALMIECAAQLASFYARKYIRWDRFVGFGGVEDCRFRQQVVPPARFYVIGKQISRRHGRLYCDMQGVVDGNIVFEAKVIGLQL
jgi:3-hydroxyacyl-[acyl-carrier-protein] dehydratase